MSTLRNPPEPDRITAMAAGLLGTRITEATPLPLSYGNVAWRVETSGGARYVVKFGDPRSEAKWRSAGWKTAYAEDARCRLQKAIA